MPEERRYCEKCKRVLKLERFYRTSRTDKYPDGFLNLCKECLTMHVDNFDPKTFTWILQEINVPYVPDEWNQLLARYGRDRSALTGTTILGRYLSKMKLKQYRDFTWADNQFLREIANSKIRDTMQHQGYTAQQIEETIQKASFSIPEGDVEVPFCDDFIPSNEPPSTPFVLNSQFDENGRFQIAELTEGEKMAKQRLGGGPVFPNFNQPLDPGAGMDEDVNDLDLTEDDIKFLRLKWGRAYNPSEWVQLEQLYNEMTSSYDIQSAGDINTLKLMCKTSLKANQLLDLGDRQNYVPLKSL